ncbi:MAG TPA: preprotein translocase subunit YajC [Saprospiraceae bacterium]|nr:preprotein translocase subunit YajC [Saprospiraceae bacterium]
MNLTIIMQSSSSGLISMLPMLAIFGVMYFFFIRPQVKKQKEQGAFINEIKKGDEVVTSSGLIGKIESIVGEEVTLLVDSKTHLRFTKGAISKEMTESFRKSTATKL